MIDTMRSPNRDNALTPSIIVRMLLAFSFAMISVEIFVVFLLFLVQLMFLRK